MHQVWRLSEYCEDNLGVCFTDDSLFLGRTPLIERQGARFAVRGRTEIERLLSQAYGSDLAVDRLLPGFATVAAALNANDPGLHELPRSIYEFLTCPTKPHGLAWKSRIFSSNRSLGPLTRMGPVPPCGDESFLLDPTDRVHKASPDDPKHPGWPAGTEGGRGGQFPPKDASELTQKVKGLIARRALRTGLRALRIGLEGLGNLIPGVDVAADVAMVADIALTVAEFRKLAIDAAAALDFVKNGPHTLEDLQVSSDDYEQFSSYDEFYKAELSVELLAKRFGTAGDGQQYHHIVTQGGANADNIPSE